MTQNVIICYVPAEKFSAYRVLRQVDAYGIPDAWATSWTLGKCGATHGTARHMTTWHEHHVDGLVHTYSTLPLFLKLVELAHDLLGPCRKCNGTINDPTSDKRVLALQNTLSRAKKTTAMAFVSKQNTLVHSDPTELIPCSYPSLKNSRFCSPIKHPFYAKRFFIVI